MLSLAYFAAESSPLVSAALSSLTPVTAVVTSCRLMRRPFLQIDVASVCATVFGVFMLSGFFALRAGYGKHYGTLGSVDYEFVTTSMLALAIICSAIVLSAADRSREWPQPRGATAPGSVPVLTQLLVGSAILGSALTVIEAGGLSSAVASLTAHNKLDAAAVGGTIGRSMWQLSALPAILCLVTQLYGRAVSRTARTVLVLELSSLFGVGLLLYGSRLLVTLTIVGAAAVYCCVRGKSIPWVTVGAAGFMLLAISIPLLTARTGDSRQTEEDLAGIISYQVLDVSLSSLEVSDKLGPLLRDPERIALSVGSIVPVVGVDAADLNSVRLDALVASYIDGGDLRRGLITGFPPSLPTALLLTYGLVGGAIAGAAFGYLARQVTNRLRALYCRTANLQWVFWYGYAMTQAFNFFKDGDLWLNFAGAMKNVIVVGILMAVVNAGRPSRGPGT